MLKKCLCLLLLLCLPLSAALAETPTAPPEMVAGWFTSMDTLVSAYLMEHSETFRGAIEDMGEAPAVIEVESLSEALMLLQSGRMHTFSTIKPTADYIAATNPAFAAMPFLGLKVDLRMVAREENADLIGRINTALAEMAADGTLEALYKTHVEDVIAGAEITAVELPAFIGAETLRIGISGDAPPIDYTTADGKPAGYNTAVAAEIGKRLNLNIELVSTEMNARFTALLADRIDVFFWEENYAPYAADAEAGITEEEAARRNREFDEANAAVRAQLQVAVSDPFLQAEAVLLVLSQP